MIVETKVMKLPYKLGRGAMLTTKFLHDISVSTRHRNLNGPNMTETYYVAFWEKIE